MTDSFSTFAIRRGSPRKFRLWALARNLAFGLAVGLVAASLVALPIAAYLVLTGPSCVR